MTHPKEDGLSITHELAGIDREAQPVSNPYKFTAEIAWLQEAARYFSKRPTSGEDAAHWSNVYNAENANKIASRLDALSRPMEAVAWRLRRVGSEQWNFWDTPPWLVLPVYADATKWEVQALAVILTPASSTTPPSA